MGFKPAKQTFLNAAGRLGAPSARKPMAKKITKTSSGTGAYAMGKKTTRGGIGKAKTVPMAKKMQTGKMKGAKNSYRMSKAVNHKTSSTLMGKKPKGNPKDNVDKRLSSYFSGVKASY